MARRIDNECAYCAEEIQFAPELVGRDRKVYCSTACARAGEQLSDRETRWLMRTVTGRHEAPLPEPARLSLGKPTGSPS